MFKRFMFLAVAATMMCLSAQAQKFGYINTSEIFNVMPEKATAENTLKTASDKYEAEFKNLQDAFQKKMTDYEAADKDASTPQAIKDRHNQELQDGAEQIFDGVLAGVQEQLTASGLDVKELTKDNYSAVLGMLKTFALGEDKEKLDGAIQQLNGLKAFCEGLNEYTNGVAQAKEGADELSEGTKTLQSGTTELLLGTNILKAALPDLSGVPEALKQSASLGQAYTSFSGLAEGMDGKVRFIWKLSGI